MQLEFRGMGDGGWMGVTGGNRPTGCGMGKGMDLFRRCPHHLADLHGRAALAAAFLGCLHKGENLNGFLGCHWCYACLEELHDFKDQWPIPAERTDRRLTLLPFGQAVESVGLAKNALASAAPKADDFNLPFRGSPTL